MENKCAEYVRAESEFLLRSGASCLLALHVEFDMQRTLKNIEFDIVLFISLALRVGQQLMQLADRLLGRRLHASSMQPFSALSL